jgi:putative oxidoreductase
VTSILERTSRFAPATHALLRVGAGILFMQHGLQKLFGMFGGFGGEPGATAPLMSQMGLASVLEVFGGLLIVLGLFTRPVALVLMLEMITAYFIAHLPRGGWPIENGGELPLLYALIFAFFATNGPGPYSLDERRGRRV